MTYLSKLAEIGSEALGPPFCTLPQRRNELGDGYVLDSLLHTKNGFYAFEQALHVFPLGSDITRIMTLEEWNSGALWKGAYGGLARDYYFFAEDIFGDQFCISKSEKGVFRFVCEVGEARPFAESLDDWARRILDDLEVQTGWPLAHSWQANFGPLQLGHRLHPKIPFVLGGKYDLDNLWSGDAVAGMLFNAELAHRLSGMRDSSRLYLDIDRKEL